MLALVDARVRVPSAAPARFSNRTIAQSHDRTPTPDLPTTPNKKTPRFDPWRLRRSRRRVAAHAFAQ
ncbi:hypothetical protein [Burkholderia multivorans]|uniref:hypothetical protein n=1 Tax=Burkholderia multivorans TaxID=87883 RepID=UPI0021BEBD07|nr:hypothetical protein [Burkholderia multivorans]